MRVESLYLQTSSTTGVDLAERVLEPKDLYSWLKVFGYHVTLSILVSQASSLLGVVICYVVRFSSK